MRRIPASGSEDFSLRVSKDAFGAMAEARETCLRANLIPPSPVGRFGAAPSVFLF